MFEHPLARAAHIGTTAGVKGKVRRILVIVTRLQLDAEHKRYKEASVKRLSDAARGWLEDHPGEAGDFMLMSRPRRWKRESA